MPPKQFEARFTMVEVPESPSILFAGMGWQQVPVVVSATAKPCRIRQR